MKPDPYAKMHRQEQKEDFLRRTFSEYLACHPTYTIPLIRAHNFIMRDNGPINPTIRYYIAIMAASRHRCSFLVNFLKKQFLLHNGNPDWIKGIEFVPPKLQLLDKINRILAHQPWLLKPLDIQMLTKNLNSWSLPELTQAIVILAHFHSLCSLAFGCKFGFEAPQRFDLEDTDYEEVEIEELRIDSSGTNKVKKIIRRCPASRLIVERCKQLAQEDAELARLISTFSIGSSGDAKAESYFDCLKPENRKKASKQPKKQDSTGVKEAIMSTSLPCSSWQIPQTQSIGATAKSTSANILSSKSSSLSSLSTRPSSLAGSDETTKTESVGRQNEAGDEAGDEQQKTSHENLNDESDDSNGFKPNIWSENEWKKHNYDVFLEEPEFAYIDFAKRDESLDVSTYRIQDYQWDDQGYSLSNYLYPDIGGFLDEKFKVGYNLTYYTLGPKTNIDTSPFRRAVWNYIQSIYGVRHDDYNYREVNILLERHLKTYIKTLACFPESIVKHDFSTVMKGFRESEKIHVIIMVAEARLQAEILYAMRALMNYMKLSG